MTWAIRPVIRKSANGVPASAPITRPSAGRSCATFAVGTTTRLSTTTAVSGSTPGRRSAWATSWRSSPREASRPSEMATSRPDHMSTVRPRASRTRAADASATAASGWENTWAYADRSPASPVTGLAGTAPDSSMGISWTSTSTPSGQGSGESMSTPPSGPRSMAISWSVLTAKCAACGPREESAEAVSTPNSVASTPVMVMAMVERMTRRVRVVCRCHQGQRRRRSGAPALPCSSSTTHLFSLTTPGGLAECRIAIRPVRKADRGAGMGEEISGTRFTRADHARYRTKVHQCLDTLEAMLEAGVFVEDEWRTGLEIELDLVDADMDPFHGNLEVLERIADPLYQTELGRFTIELNVEPRRNDGRSLEQLESALRRNLNRTRDRAGDLGAGLVMIGTLPTLPTPPPGQGWFTDSDRYRALGEAVMSSRHEDITLEVTGAEQLSLTMDSISAEAACTSTQLHLQVTPERYAAYWNAAQLLAGPQLAVGANSPYLFGHQLHAETRIEVFAQSTDARSPELRTRGVRPPGFCGDQCVRG